VRKPRGGRDYRPRLRPIRFADAFAFQRHSPTRACELMTRCLRGLACIQYGLSAWAGLALLNARELEGSDARVDLSSRTLVCGAGPMQSAHQRVPIPNTPAHGRSDLLSGYLQLFFGLQLPATDSREFLRFIRVCVNRLFDDLNRFIRFVFFDEFRRRRFGIPVRLGSVL